MMPFAPPNINPSNIKQQGKSANENSGKEDRPKKPSSSKTTPTSGNLRSFTPSFLSKATFRSTTQQSNKPDGIASPPFHSLTSASSSEEANTSIRNPINSDGFASTHTPFNQNAETLTSPVPYEKNKKLTEKERKKLQRAAKNQEGETSLLRAPYTVGSQQSAQTYDWLGINYEGHESPDKLATKANGSVYHEEPQLRTATSFSQAAMGASGFPRSDTVARGFNVPSPEQAVGTHATGVVSRGFGPSETDAYLQYLSQPSISSHEQLLLSWDAGYPPIGMSSCALGVPQNSPEISNHGNIAQAAWDTQSPASSVEPGRMDFDRSYTSSQPARLAPQRPRPIRVDYEYDSQQVESDLTPAVPYSQDHQAGHTNYGELENKPQKNLNVYNPLRAPSQAVLGRSFSGGVLPLSVAPGGDIHGHGIRSRVASAPLVTHNQIAPRHQRSLPATPDIEHPFTFNPNHDYYCDRQPEAETSSVHTFNDNYVDCISRASSTSSRSFDEARSVDSAIFEQSDKETVKQTPPLRITSKFKIGATSLSTVDSPTDSKDMRRSTYNLQSLGEGKIQKLAIVEDVNLKEEDETIASSPSTTTSVPARVVSGAGPSTQLRARHSGRKDRSTPKKPKSENGRLDSTVDLIDDFLADLHHANGEDYVLVQKTGFLLSMSPEERATIVANNRSLRSIKNELENLLATSAIDDAAYDTIMGALPNEASPNASGTSRAPAAHSQVPSAAPVPSLGNLSIHDAPPPSYPSSVPVLPSRSPSAAPGPRELCRASVAYEFAGPDAGDVRLNHGDQIAVYEYLNADWWRGKNLTTGQEGMFPRGYVTPQPQAQPASPYSGYSDPKGNMGYGGGYPGQYQQQGPPPPGPSNPYNSAVPPMQIAEQPAEAQPGKGQAMAKKFGSK